MDSDRTLNRSPNPRFDSTQWSLVMAAQHRSTPDGRDAFAELCEKYWYPLYAHARRIETNEHDAVDLTQGFFEKVMDRNYIADADPARGRFRTFLLTSFSNYIRNERDKSQAVKRGGGKRILSIEIQQNENRYLAEPADTTTPERMFDRRWAETILGSALELLQKEYEDSGRGQLFAELKQYLMAGTTEGYSQVSDRLGMKLSATKVAVHRLRTRFRAKLCDEIEQTLATGDELDDEIHCLFEAFASR